MAFGYQNQTSAWWLGGDNINVNGYGYGTLDGNGQAWYDFVKGISNYPNRPHALTIWNATNSVFKGLRFVQSQMWTMTVFKSSSILLQDIYVNSTSSSGSPSRNTDGADTIYSDNIHFDRWTVVNGDDSISMKANSTNILITNSTFYNGLGVAIGSIGQYKGVYESIENVTATGIVFYKTLHGGYVKTWTGEQVGYPPNGGGGGLGFAKNITFENFSFHSLRGPPFSISQCTTFSGTVGNCSSSAFQLSDLNMYNISGSMTNPITSFQCSAVAPCTDITMENINVVDANKTAGVGYKCTNTVRKTISVIDYLNTESHLSLEWNESSHDILNARADRLLSEMLISRYKTKYKELKKALKEAKEENVDGKIEDASAAVKRTDSKIKSLNSSIEKYTSKSRGYEKKYDEEFNGGCRANDKKSKAVDE
ncbi:hypothetical protein ACHAPF_000659 [Botrytis cinerea]